MGAFPGAYSYPESGLLVKGLSEKPASGGQMVAETRVTPLIAFGDRRSHIRPYCSGWRRCRRRKKRERTLVKLPVYQPYPSVSQYRSRSNQFDRFLFDYTVVNAGGTLTLKIRF